MLMLQQKVKQLKNMCSRIENQRKQSVVDWLVSSLVPKVGIVDAAINNHMVVIMTIDWEEYN
jgi:hypothetical protein